MWEWETAVVVVTDDAQRVLLVHQSYGHRFFGLPGGVLDKGETAREAAVREVLEETGLAVTVGDARVSTTPARHARKSWKSLRRSRGTIRCSPNPTSSGSATTLSGSRRCSSDAVCVLPPPNGPLIQTSTCRT